MFSSAGVGCYGFKLNGFECIATNELLDARMAVQKANHKCKYESGYIGGDIAAEDTHKRLFNEIDMWKEKEGISQVDVVFATPPCQGMSTANYKKADNEQVRNSLVVQAVKLISLIQPKIFIFENVRAFMNTVISMYMKAVWYSGGKGQGLNEFRREMLEDTRISIFSDYPDPKVCHIDGISLRGGVCAFLWDAVHNGKCKFISHINEKVYESTRFLKTDGEGILIRYSQGLGILRKVKEKREDVFSDCVSRRDPFGLGDVFDTYMPKPTSECTIKLYCVKKRIGYIRRNQVADEYRPLCDKWKVLVAKASPGEDTLPHSVISAPVLSEPNSVCTNGLLVVKAFDSKREALNLIDYMHTSFFRFMMLLAKNGHNLTNNVYRYVPVVDLSRKWTDAELFERYGITEPEQDFIRSVIKDIH